jgi:hypothetical protein
LIVSATIVRPITLAGSNERPASVYLIVSAAGSPLRRSRAGSSEHAALERTCDRQHSETRPQGSPPLRRASELRPEPSPLGLADSRLQSQARPGPARPGPAGPWQLLAACSTSAASSV